MKPVKTLLLAAAVLIMLITSTGCLVQSVNPFFVKEAVCTVPGIEGEWILLDKDGKPEPAKPWVFEAGRITTYEKISSPGRLSAVYFKAGDSFFLDTSADDPGDQPNKWWTMHVSPIHLLTRLEIHENSLVLAPLDFNWLEKALEDKTVALPHLRQKDGETLLFTALPEEWTSFIRKYAKDKNVFSEENALRFRRQKAKD